jgi:uncharacterized repeat protein (TIGR03847 family)
VLIDLDPVDRITTGAVGPPGKRVFYLQGRKEERLVTVLVEKQQVELLAASLVEVVARSGRETGTGPDEAEMGLEEPIVPEWRAGRLSIGYDEARDRILLEAEEIAPDQEEEEAAEPPPDDPARVRFWASREQAIALARHGATVAAAGRPRCELCGNPKDPDGHVCPALDGHGELV